jgi:hypothetical protein
MMATVFLTIKKKIQTAMAFLIIWMPMMTVTESLTTKKEIPTI